MADKHLVYELRDKKGHVLRAGMARDLADAFSGFVSEPWWEQVDPDLTTATEYDSEAAGRAALDARAQAPEPDPLAALAAFAQDQRTMPARRLALVDEARAAGITWRDIAAALEMSEEGLRKAVRRR